MENTFLRAPATLRVWQSRDNRLQEPPRDATTGRSARSVEDALCVGDAPNDLPMFELLRWSVAVGGAFDVVAEAANVVSPHPHGATFPPLVDAILARKTGDEA